MTDPLTHRLARLSTAANRPLLARGLHGIERETLRVDASGRLAMTPHPRALGSALTNPLITTDYSESLLESVTTPANDIADAVAQLDRIHRYACSELGGELLWSQSMPCLLPADDEIPIAWYGTSNIGRLKHIYRRGLALRYGRTMQCIAGIHYNYSLAEDVWRLLQADEQAGGSAADFQSGRYIALVRNFDRSSWLLMVLLGASPALSESFLSGRPHQLERLSADTLYLPFATSLRMSDLGYKNNAQVGLLPTYNDLRSYMANLQCAVQRPHAPYQQIGTRRDGEWVQINTNVLQIENEYYATIRPKRVIKPGERPLEALARRGVQYVEVRCLDVDPFEPVGISLETSRFLDAFLLFCAFDDSPPTSSTESTANAANFADAVKQGRRPGLELRRGGTATPLRAWGLELLERIEPCAALLDAQLGDDSHARALAAQRAKLQAPELMPSARVLDALRADGGSFQAFGLQMSRRHAASFRARPLDDAEQRGFVALAQTSLAEQREMERTQSSDFDRFIADYQRLPALP